MEPLIGLGETIIVLLLFNGLVFAIELLLKGTSGLRKQQRI
jgi:hypothetical protein